MKNEQRNKIGLIIADENEIQQMNEFKLIKVFEHSIFKTKLYEYKNLDVFVIHSRIGLTNAAAATQFLIDKFQLNEIWNYGAVGSAGKFQLFDVLIPTHFYYHDAITPWYKRGQIPQEKEFYENGLKSESGDCIYLASGNCFLNDVKKIEEIKKEMKIDLIDMEACAMAQVCDLNNVNFYCVKAISDVIGISNANDKMDINQKIALASEKAFKKILELWENKY